MNITIDSEVLLRALLKGNMMDSCIVTEEFGNAISKIDPNNPFLPAVYFHLEPCSLYTGKGYILWSKVGWENELKRRAYIEGLPHEFEVRYMPKPKRTEKMIKDELMQASMKGDLETAKKLMEELKGLQ